MGSPDDAAAAPGAAVNAGTIRDPVPLHQLGSVTLTPGGAFEAGSYASFALVYTAGKFGIDDSGSLRVCFRFASDQTRPQFEDPARPNYTTIEASNNAVLEYRYDPKGNVRPWDRTLYIKVVKGFLREGDTIAIRFGVTGGGSPGMRLQTFCEDTFEFRVLVDPIATFNFQALPEQPVIRIVPGPPESYVAILPTLRRVGERFSLKLKGEDKWGNPSDKCDVTFRARASMPVRNLPETVTFKPGTFAVEIDDLSVADTGDLTVELIAPDSSVAARANPLRIVKEAALLPFWADLHGQSEETIGTNSAEAYFAFARDRAFVDACGHQGNDFQITTPFWNELNRVTAAFNAPGRFVTLPGYEWSGNTGLGGDRNIFFPEEGRQIRRSSHALVEDKSDVATDCNHAAELFEAFVKDRELDVVAYAHCGGRYADVKLAHDGRIEKSMEVHSSWGTFEWLVQDAFEMGYRTGIVANSDGHKGRPGASYPGASLFGAVGGLTCLLMPALTREAVLDCLRKRRHYATTGSHGGRMVIGVSAAFDADATLYHDDPALGPAEGHVTRTAMMGDIVHLPGGEVELAIDILAAAPIERVDLFNGLEPIETIRPYGPDRQPHPRDVGRRGIPRPLPPGDLGRHGASLRQPHPRRPAFQLLQPRQVARPRRRVRPRVEGAHHRQHRRLRHLGRGRLRRHAQDRDAAGVLRRAAGGDRLRRRSVRQERPPAALPQGLPAAGGEPPPGDALQAPCPAARHGRQPAVHPPDAGGRHARLDKPHLYLPVGAQDAGTTCHPRHPRARRGRT